MARRRSITCPGGRLLAGVVAQVIIGSAILAEPPTADAVLTDMGFSASERQRVLAGEFVTSKVGSVSDRDLSFAVAFLVKARPESIEQKALSGALFAADAQVQSFGMLSPEGRAEDFSGLHLTDGEARALAAAEPGDALNLSAEERAAFKAAAGQPAQAVLNLLERTLLARYRSYRTSGLRGIAPYDRGHGHLAEVAADLLKANQSATGVQKYMPALYALLASYPEGTLPVLKENFLWVKSVVRDKPTYVLAHVISVGDGEARAVVRREFYVSAGYDAEQSVAGFLPVEQGTVVLCLSHAFSDQVAGSGGSMKRSIGSRVMASEMKEIFEKGRKQIER